MKLLFDFDDEHSYISRLNEQIKEIVVNSTDDKSTIIPSDDSINQILKESEELENFESDYIRKLHRQIIFQYLETKNKLFLPLFFVYDHLLNHFKNEKLLSFSEINADKWEEFLHKLKEKYNEDQVIQKIDSDFEFQEEKKIINAIRNKYLKPYAFEIKNGSIGLDTVKLQNVTRKIERLIQKLGGFPFLANIFNNLKVHYYNSTYHRYVFKIPPQDLIGIPKSEFPWNYLILLGFKNIYYEKQVDCNEQDVYTEIMETSRSLISLYELEQFTNVSRLISRMKFDEEQLYKYILFSNLYRFQQCNKVFFSKVISDLLSFTQENENDFQNYLGFSIQKYIDLINKLILYAPDSGIYQINKNIFSEEILLIDKLSHKNSICENYNFPTAFDKIENYVVMRPFVKFHDQFYFIDCSYSLWNFYNALFLLLEDNDSLRNTISKEIGINIEKILKDECYRQNLRIHYGHYQGSDFESDLVIETEKSIIFIECKKKEFSASALSGDRNKLLDDYIKSVAEAHSQCLAHSAFLYTNKKMEFKESNSILELKNREIIRVSVGLFDAYALNEHYNTMNGLEFISHKRYLVNFYGDVPEKTRKKELKKAENSNKKLESIAKNLKQLNDDDLMKQRITNMNSWNLSLEHILFLLQQIRLKNIELDDLLSSMRKISCCSSDFYTEYEKAMAMSE